VTVGNVNTWTKIRDPKSNNVDVRGSFVAGDGEYLIPNDIELSSIRAVSMSPLDIPSGSQAMVTGSFEKGDARDIPSGSVQLGIQGVRDGGTITGIGKTFGSIRVGYDAVGW